MSPLDATQNASRNPIRIVPTPPAREHSYCFTVPTDFVTRIFSVPALLSMQERLMLYTLIVSLQPDRVREIGACYGGSTAIMACAMDGVGKGTIYSIDPDPQIADELRASIELQLVLHIGYSPSAVSEVARQAGAPCEFAFIDGSHERDAVAQDLMGVLPHLADGGSILLHDAYCHQVRAAIDEVCAAQRDRLEDCGVIVRSGGKIADVLGPSKSSSRTTRPSRSGASARATPFPRTASAGLRLRCYASSGFGPAHADSLEESWL
jgi:predicted O-methyltransferase YrrM